MIHRDVEKPLCGGFAGILKGLGGQRLKLRGSQPFGEMTTWMLRLGFALYLGARLWKLKQKWSHGLEFFGRDCWQWGA